MILLYYLVIPSIKTSTHHWSLTNLYDVSSLIYLWLTHVISVIIKWTKPNLVNCIILFFEWNGEVETFSMLLHRTWYKAITWRRGRTVLFCHLENNTLYAVELLVLALCQVLPTGMAGALPEVAKLWTMVTARWAILHSRGRKASRISGDTTRESRAARYSMIWSRVAISRRRGEIADAMNQLKRRFIYKSFIYGSVK